MGSVFDPLGVTIFIQLDIKLDWLELTYGSLYPIPVAARGRIA